MKSKFEKELSAVINKYSRENGSNTPDYLLASYLNSCLLNFDGLATILCQASAVQYIMTLQQYRKIVEFIEKYLKVDLEPYNKEGLILALAQEFNVRETDHQSDTPPPERSKNSVFQDQRSINFGYPGHLGVYKRRYGPGDCI